MFSENKCLDSVHIREIATIGCRRELSAVEEEPDNCRCVVLFFNIWKHSYENDHTSVTRWVLPFVNNPKNLDPSYKMDLDFCGCFGRVTPISLLNFIRLI